MLWINDHWHANSANNRSNIYTLLCLNKATHNRKKTLQEYQYMNGNIVCIKY